MIPTVRVKPGVTFLMGPASGFRILGSIERLAFHLGRDVTISSGSDGPHKVGSAHDRGEAYDLRTRDWDSETVRRALLWLRNDLGPLFLVLYEMTSEPEPGSPLAGIVSVNPKATAPHIHLQPKRGTTYPPPTGV